ncbi:hypothetical protein CSUI_009936 [Cystoisospora suis]|uniref:Uncharacterized protein n=1 Tax=Cystoisospora suis TaxID=483139 RepID=A0A2C6KIB3_9APIC|nr:hypothetical protein CSUI_009936 [Cystoisospora suis]
MASIQSVFLLLLLKFFSPDSFYSFQPIRVRLLIFFFFFSSSSSLLFSSCFHLHSPFHPSSSLHTSSRSSSSVTSPLLSHAFLPSISSTSSSHLSSLFFSSSPSLRPSFSLSSSSPHLLLSSFQLHLSVTPPSFMFHPTSTSSPPSVLFATLRSGRPKASRSSSSPKRQKEEEDEEDDGEEEDEEDRTSFSFDPTKVTSRFGNLTGGGVYTPETAPPFPAETPYFPSFPPKYVTPIPPRLPRWHPRSPFPSLQPRGPFYPQAEEEREEKKEKKTPRFRQFKGKAPPPGSLPSPVIELKRHFKSWVRTPHYQYPQFTSLSASIKYRRRLKKSSRRLDLRLAKNLPYRRMYFAWRRNMRDQEMHRWMCEKARVSLLTSRYWKHRYALQASEWRASRQATKSLQGEQEEEDEENKDHLSPMKEEEIKIEEEEEGEKEEGEGSEDDDMEDEMTYRNASSSKTAYSLPDRLIKGHTTIFEEGREVGKEEEEDLKSEKEKRRIHNEILSYIEQHEELYEEVVHKGYQLPRMTAAIASSPFPWWTSVKGLHKWRGRKTSSNVQSRWINWSKPTRTIEAALGDRLIPRGGKILSFLKEKGKELEETLSRQLQGRDTEEDNDKDEEERGEKEMKEEEEEEEDGEDIEEREERDDGDEEEEEEEEEEETEETGEEEKEDEREDCFQSQKDITRMKEEKEKEEEEEEIRRKRRKRRAIEAAMDVSILLGQSLITKESGASNPYDVYSPFVKTERSSRRRRMRLRGRKSLLEHPEEKNMSRQERRLTRFAKRREESRDRQDSDAPGKG